MYTKLYLGGTFDHFHAGHARFLETAAANGEQLVIGVTEQSLTSTKRWADLIQPFAERAAAVEAWCQKNAVAAEIVLLRDPFGPAVSAPAENAGLVVTTATEAGGAALNAARERLGLSPLPVLVADLLMAEDGQPIASERIRGGAISRSGMVYQRLLAETVKLSETQREELRQLPGQAVWDTARAPELQMQAYLVGDETTRFFRENGWQYSLAVVDGYSRREELRPPVLAPELIDLSAVNPAGQITRHMSQTLQTALTQQLRHVFIQGEEDLAAVVLALYLPLGTVIFFGVHDQGLISLTVTEALKSRLAAVLISDPNLSQN